jgi:hypothetical protein
MPGARNQRLLFYRRVNQQRQEKLTAPQAGAVSRNLLETGGRICGSSRVGGSVNGV